MTSILFPALTLFSILPFVVANGSRINNAVERQMAGALTGDSSCSRFMCINATLSENIVECTFSAD
ncbi:hypothetical protein GYMLUDRAFT_35455 [Collybiopsis luxurians FD-317 M1]|nr:hypothetical protein GYMLUDRAFT_35455 [Collybiopsis luxurians FD-317 M1]